MSRTSIVNQPLRKIHATNCNGLQQYFPLTIAHKAGVALFSNRIKIKINQPIVMSRPGHTHTYTQSDDVAYALLCFSTLLFCCRFFSPQPCWRPLSLASLENSITLFVAHQLVLG